MKICILVYDPSLKDRHAKFYSKLHDEGFQACKPNLKGNVFHGQPWVFVKLDSMTYVPGMIGIKMGDPIGDHAVTIDEFWLMYYMFKSVFDKYKGLSVLDFPKNQNN